MTKVSRVIAIAGGCIFLVLISFYFYSGNHSEQTALGLVQDYCHDNNLDPTKLSGPVDGNVDGRALSYSWTYKDGAHNLELLVSFDYFYNSKLAIWDYNRKD